MSAESLYPEIEVQLAGQDGNAMVIISTVRAALRNGGVDVSKIAKFTQEATSGDYDNLLRTAMKWVSVS